MPEFQSSYSSQLITAIDLEDNEKSIQRIVEEKVSAFNKKRLRRDVKKLRDSRKIIVGGEQPAEEAEESETEKAVAPMPDGMVTHEEIEAMRLGFYGDAETATFRSSQYESIKAQRENYHEIRKTIDGLNEMPWYAAEVERWNIQRVSKFLKYDEVIALSTASTELFQTLRKKVRDVIENKILWLGTSANLDEYDSLGLILTMREMYAESTETDDIELFEKYNLETNIDLAHRLSDIMFQKVAFGDRNKNIVNEFLPKSKTLASLTGISNMVYQQVVSNKMLGVLFSRDFVTNNSVTCQETMYTTNTELDLVYRTRTLGELLIEITNVDVSEQSKAERQQIYMTYDGFRPSMENYFRWNGLQVFDLDLKEWKMMGGDIDILKAGIHNMMVEFHWYLWICRSASGNGLHIYTKVTPPHHVYTLDTDNEYISRYWHQVNYQTKASNIHEVLWRLHNINGNGISFDYRDKAGQPIWENRYMDNVVARITAGIRLAYDPMPMVNHNFVDMHVGLALGQTIDGYEAQKTINRVLLRATSMQQRIDDDLAVDDPVEHLEKRANAKPDLSKFVALGGDLTQLKHLSGKIDYNIRYSVCNTLAAIFGKDGLPMAHTILDSERLKNKGEINSFYSCAISNRKEPSKYGLEILKKAGIIKSVEPEMTETLDTSFKSNFSRQIMKSLQNSPIVPMFKLGETEYISDFSDRLVSIISGTKINIVLSPPGSGKTEFVKHLAKIGKRILLVLPYISVIKNKIELDQTITDNFDTFYGSQNIKDLEYGRNAVTTFDKFSRSNYEKLSKMFDYIMIDESHLLFTSSYRIEATSNVIKKIKELFFISSNDPFAAKLVLFTGTETGELSFFSQFANTIRIAKPSHEKKMEFLICGDTLDSITRLATKAVELIREGYKLMIPTNKGEIYSEKIIGMVEYLMQRPIKYGYYKRSNTEQEICRLINVENTVGDYEIVFCSNYLSVGVDINDRCKFASIYLGAFSGYEIEQFNARIRKMGIRSIYCVTTSKMDGTVNDLLLNEPDLLLKITDEDTLFFIDDKAIAGAKTEFIASYDPVLHRIVTPGFSLLNGKIIFNLEEYELVSFEQKYALCMEHPIKVARELAKYGYIVSVSTEYEGLSESEKDTLKKMGIEAAKEEKVRKHNLLVGTYVDLVKGNTHVNQHGLEFNNVIEWISKHQDKIIEDRELTRVGVGGEIENCYVAVTFDMFATPVDIIVKSKEALEKMLKSALYMTRKYSQTKALDIIYGYVGDDGILKQKLFTRAINLLRLIDSSEANELADPIMRSLEKMYDFVDKFEARKDFRIGYETYQSILGAWTNEYIDSLGIKVHTKYGFDKIQDGLQEMLADLAMKQSGKNGIRFSYNKLPDTDSAAVLNRRSIDGIVQNMFHLSQEIINSRQSKVKSKHIILSVQAF
jgi:hypothetical protein